VIVLLKLAENTIRNMRRVAELDPDWRLTSLDAVARDDFCKTINGLLLVVGARTTQVQEEVSDAGCVAVDAPFLQGSLQGQHGGLFGAISRRLLSTHRDIAARIRDAQESVVRQKLEWHSQKHHVFARPTELLPSLLHILPAELDDDKLSTARSHDDKETARSQILERKASQSTVKCPFIWGEANLAQINTEPRMSRAMEILLARMLVFALDEKESGPNFLTRAAKTALPLMRKAVALLQEDPLFWVLTEETRVLSEDTVTEDFDNSCEEMVEQSFFGPSIELLSSQLQSALKLGRDRHAAQLAVIKRLSQDIADAKSKSPLDLTAVMAAEEALIRECKLGLEMLDVMLTLLKDPKYPERFLDGDTGKLAVAQSQTSHELAGGDRELAKCQDQLKSDLLTLSELRSTVYQEIASQIRGASRRKYELTQRRDELDGLIRAASRSSAWHWQADCSMISAFLACDFAIAEADIFMDKCRESRHRVANEFSIRRSALVDYAANAGKCTELLKTVRLIADIGIRSVQTELRARMAMFGADRASLLTDLLQLFTLRYSLLAGRQRALIIRQASIVRKRKELTLAMEEAAAALEVERHTKHARDIADQDRLESITKAELSVISADIALMEADQASTNAFVEAKVDHPRIAAATAAAAAAAAAAALHTLAASKSHVKRAIIDPLETILQQLASLGINPAAVLLAGLTHVPPLPVRHMVATDTALVLPPTPPRIAAAAAAAAALHTLAASKSTIEPTIIDPLQTILQPLASLGVDPAAVLLVGLTQAPLLPVAHMVATDAALLLPPAPPATTANGAMSIIVERLAQLVQTPLFATSTDPGHVAATDRLNKIPLLASSIVNSGRPALTLNADLKQTLLPSSIVNSGPSALTINVDLKEPLAQVDNSLRSPNICTYGTPFVHDCSFDPKPKSVEAMGENAVTPRRALFLDAPPAAAADAGAGAAGRATIELLAALEFSTLSTPLVNIAASGASAAAAAGQTVGPANDAPLAPLPSTQSSPPSPASPSSPPSPSHGWEHVHRSTNL
jgi:hypothetical protein